MSCHIDDESPTRYLTGRGILFLPKQEKEIDNVYFYDAWMTRITNDKDEKFSLIQF